MTLEHYRKIAPKVEQALEAALIAHGLKMGKLRVGVDSFAGTVRFTIEAADTALKDKDGKPTTPEAIHWNQYAQVYDLKPEWLGATLKNGGKTFVIRGLRMTRSPKNVVLNHDGKTYFTTADAVRRQLGAAR
jgi:hypothetical protein